jgi:hypothetical protein
MIELTRQKMIDLCCFNDPDGCYEDSQCEAEGLQPLSDATLLEILQGWADEDHRSLEGIVFSIDKEFIKQMKDEGLTDGEHYICASTQDQEWHIFCGIECGLPYWTTDAEGVELDSCETLKEAYECLRKEISK